MPVLRHSPHCLDAPLARFAPAWQRLRRGRTKSLLYTLFTGTFPEKYHPPNKKFWIVPNFVKFSWRAFAQTSETILKTRRAFDAQGVAPFGSILPNQSFNNSGAPFHLLLVKITNKKKSAHSLLCASVLHFQDYAILYIF